MGLDIERWHEHFEARGSDGMRAVVLDSWRRSRAAGVNAETAEITLHRVSAAELSERLTRNRRLIDAAEPHLLALSRAVGAVAHVVYLVDADGIVLHALGDEPMRTRFGLTPGYDWSERRMGTNGAGTALAERRPVAIVGAEHYVELFGGCTCTAAPIFDAAGRIAGALDVSSAVHDAAPERLEQVVQTAQAIEADLRAQRDAGTAAGLQDGARRTGAAEPRAHTLHWHMMRLLLVAFLPLVVAGALIVWQYWASQARLVEQRLRDHVESVADAMEREIAVNRGQLEVLAASELIDRGDLQALHRQARAVVAERPLHLIVLTDDNGQILFNTALPWGAPLPNVWRLDSRQAHTLWRDKPIPVSSQALTKGVFTSGAAAYSGLYFGVTLQRPAVALAVPVIRGGRTRYALTLSFPPDALETLIERHTQGDDFDLAIVDAGGVVIAASTRRHVPAEQGDRLDAAFLQRAAAGPRTLHDFTLAAGRRAFEFYTRSTTTGWYVRAVVPRDVAFDALHTAGNRVLLLLLAVLSLIVLTSGLLARRISRALQGLGAMPNEPAAAPPAQKHRILEVERLRERLQQAAQSEQRRHAERLARLEAEHAASKALAAERSLRGVLDNLYVFVAVLDRRGMVVEVNDAPLARAGIDRSDVLGRMFWDCYWWQHEAEVRQRVAAAFQDVLAGRSVRFDVSLQVAGAASITVDFSMAAVRDDERVAYVIASCMDVTERVLARQALVEANRQISEMSARKDEFLAMLSHELRNPLGVLRTGAHILDRVQADSDQALQARRIITRQTEHLARLVDDLLDVTRIARGKFELKREPLRLLPLLQTAVNDQIASANKPGPAIALHAPPDDVWCCTDPVRFEQVLRNLLDNAVKFTPSDGRIDVRLVQAGRHARIEVCDTGAGIEPHVAPHLFDAFVQGDVSLARTSGGLGLGLALVKGIVEMQGGRVGVSSAGPGQGTTFYFELPLVEAPGAASAAPEHDGPSEIDPPATARVLVVDDNHDGADCLATLLAMRGYRADVAYDASQALTLLERERYAVVLSDIGLPGIDGYELAAQVRRTAPHARLVAVTGYGQPDDVARAHAAGFDRHVVKPVDPQLLERMLAELLHVERAQ